jgi:hypothetical protein
MLGRLRRAALEGDPAKRHTASAICRSFRLAHVGGALPVVAPAAHIAYRTLVGGFVSLAS